MSNVLLQRSDTILIGIMIDIRSAGIYAATTKIVELVSIGLTSVGVVFAPLSAEAWDKGDRKHLQTLTTQAARAGAGLSLLLAFGLVVFGVPILGLFGSGFESGSTVLAILVVGRAINASCGPAGWLLNMTGRHRAAASISMQGAILNILLNLVLIPRFGIEGAAVATAFSVALLNARMSFTAWSKLGIRSWLTVGSLRPTGSSSS